MTRTIPTVANQNGRRPEPDIEVVLITPELARQWLNTTNKRNRKPKRAKIRQYVGAMQRGEWRLNGDTIRFDYHGVLLDGQNRLTAIIESGVSITQWVATGLEPEAQDTMDVGARRTLADSLAIKGYVDVQRLGSVTRWAWMYERYVNENISMIDRSRPPTNQQLIAFLEERKSRLTVATREGGKIYTKLRALSPAMGGVAWYVFHEINWEDCQDFFHKLSKGASLEEDNPIFVLRRWLQNDYERRERSRPEVVFAVVVKAWNAYRDGVKIGGLRWVGGGRSPEKFPIAR